jgi:hypothetical protein
MFRYCHRCNADLPAHDEGTLIFCSHCGAPQVLLSEDLQLQMEAAVQASGEGAAATSKLHGSRAQVWAGAIRCAALAGAIAAGLAGISILLPPVILITWLWAVISPVVVIGLFQARYPMAALSAGFGARLGLLTGLTIAAALSIINTSDLLVRRFVTHSMGDFDGQWIMLMKQMQDALAAQPGNAAVGLGLVRAFQIPEFRAGFLLAGMAIASAILVVVTTAGGAFAGFVRSRQKA